jgi:hypothetical protein
VLLLGVFSLFRININIDVCIVEIFVLSYACTGIIIEDGNVLYVIFLVGKNVIFVIIINVQN